MIEAKTKFEKNNLIIDINVPDVDNHRLEIPIANDVNFKELVELLIKIIPVQTKISITNEEIPEGDTADKLQIIQDTVNEIFKGFNSSMDELLEEPKEDESKVEVQEESSIENDDLPF
ncbi:hypothetical protein HME9304_01830 [Flagellimonas maritima]|uniref:Uncharacterized protein n=1 Tax=Flagellimonas maritima TaxID=1383885 RepID=A0A2Z4LSF5_9FLAO|nr:hypothetical protein [Allomuricauda aurantiaca]AWX44825.1 hypothetical protein HME9304_01830 [Allomuricauda aurantiaca]